MAKKARMGRPVTPTAERLVAYGLHLSPDKKAKLLEVKEHEGISIREWVEDHIERDWLAMQQSIAEQKADRKAARERAAASR